MFVISRFINGICLNDKEYVLDAPEGNVMKFKTYEDAVEFLTDNGVKIGPDTDIFEECGCQIEEEHSHGKSLYDPSSTSCDVRLVSGIIPHH